MLFSRDQAIALGSTGACSTTAPRTTRGRWSSRACTYLRRRGARSRDGGHALVRHGLVSHATAAVLWGFEGIRTRSGSPHGGSERPSPRSATVKVHRAGEPFPADVGRGADCGHLGACGRRSISRGSSSRRRSKFAIESGLRRGCSGRPARWRADPLMGTGRRGSSELRALLDRHDLGRTDSAWEVRTAQLLDARRLRPPVRQHPIFDGCREIVRADLAYPDAELRDRVRQRPVAQRNATAATWTWRRRNRLRSLGWTVVEVTPATLRDPTRFITTVETVLAA